MSEEDEKSRALAAEHNAIIAGIGNVTRVWATVESSLLFIFTSLAHLEEEYAEIGGVIFFTPSNTETRIAMVDTLVTYQLELINGHPKDEMIVTLWRKIKGKIDTLKRTRNAVVHGLVATTASNKHGQSVRLTPQFLDSLKITPQVRSGQKIGLGSNELGLHCDAVYRVMERLGKLYTIIGLRMKLKQKSDGWQEDHDRMCALLEEAGTPPLIKAANESPGL